MKCKFGQAEIIAVVRFFSIIASVVSFILCGFLAVPVCWFTLRYGAPEILSGSLKYDWNVVYAGGGFDQFGLTKLVICIFATSTTCLSDLTHLIVQLSRMEYTLNLAGVFAGVWYNIRQMFLAITKPVEISADSRLSIPQKEMPGWPV